MTSRENVLVLRQGVRAWNQWRALNSDVVLDLSQADLASSELPYSAPADDPYDGYLEGVNFNNMRMSGVILRGLMVKGASFVSSDLRGADLSFSTFFQSSFDGACLEGANLTGARFVDVQGVDSPRTKS